MYLPSGDQVGCCICIPRSEPVTVAGSTTTSGWAPGWFFCVYNLADHQLSSPGGGAAVYVILLSSGERSNSYTYKLAEVTMFGVPPEAGTSAIRSTCTSCWPMTPT